MATKKKSTKTDGSVAEPKPETTPERSERSDLDMRQSPRFVRLKGKTGDVIVNPNAIEYILIRRNDAEDSKSVAEVHLQGLQVQCHPSELEDLV
jgi:hypothetical protein